jgi:UDP-glucose 4-epimerase
MSSSPCPDEHSARSMNAEFHEKHGIVGPDRPLSLGLVGGAGFIGSFLSEMFASQGHDVTVLDLHAPRVSLDQYRFLLCDVRLADPIRPASTRFDVVFMLASLLAKGCIEDPSNGWRTNLMGLTHVVDQLRSWSPKPLIVFFSSAMVYSPAAPSPISEEAPLRGHGLYGTSKLAGEAVLHTAAEAWGLSAVILRPFTVFGPGPAAGSRGHFIATWMERVVAGIPLTIYGTGEQIVDLVHITDLAEVCRRAIGYARGVGGVHTFNVGGGGVAVRDIARWIQQEAPRATLEYLADRLPIAERRVADITRIREALAYQPRISPESGIKALVRQHLPVARELRRSTSSRGH